MDALKNALFVSLGIAALWAGPSWGGEHSSQTRIGGHGRNSRGFHAYVDIDMEPHWQERGFTHHLIFPDDYNGDRLYRAFPEATLADPVTVERRAEYDTYGIGNTAKVEREYVTRKRTDLAPSLIVDPFSHRHFHFDRRRDGGRRDPLAVVETTEKSMVPLNAERASVPGREHVRLARPDGTVAVVPPEAYYGALYGPARQSEKIGEEVWIPRRLREK